MHAWDLVIVGGGAAGLMAGIRAGELGLRPLLLEKNPQPGAKIRISGGARCNLTHATDARGIVRAFGPAGRFLHSALAAWGPQQVVDLFAAEGVPTKVEPDGKVFPASDRASDVAAALVRRLRNSGCELALGEAVERVDRDGAGFRVSTTQRALGAAGVVLATGGRSYPSCGTTGDGYLFAAEFGHAIVRPRPALVPLTSDTLWVRALQGVTVPDVHVRVFESPESESGELRLLAQRREALLFTHFGISGPAVMDVSRALSGHAQPRAVSLICDFLPDIKADQLDAWLQTEAARAGRRHVVGILALRLPQRLVDALVQQASIPPDRRGAELSKAERQRLVEAVKHRSIPVSGTLGFDKAEVTAGGVCLEEVDSHTMQSKLVPGLYLAGELLDLDGPIGGYNFQAAFSTGWLAGHSAAIVGRRGHPSGDMGNL